MRTGTAILYGIEFDAEKPLVLAQKQELAHEYLMQGQVELLRER
jgi:hypothetical protein